MNRVTHARSDSCFSRKDTQHLVDVIPRNIYLRVVCTCLQYATSNSSLNALKISADLRSGEKERERERERTPRRRAALSLSQ